jgi:hypothetical protein
LDAKEKALLHQQNVEFRKRMEYLDREYQTKAAALDERISAVYEFDLSHVEKMSGQERKIAALEQDIQLLQKQLLEKDARIDALTENQLHISRAEELSSAQPSRMAFHVSAKQSDSLKMHLKDSGQKDDTFGGISKVSPIILPEIHAQSDKDSEFTAVQTKLKERAQTSIELAAGVATEPQYLDASSGLKVPVMHRSSMRSEISTASFRNRDFPSLSQSNVFMTPQTSRILDQQFHSKPLSYSLQKHAPEASQQFSLSMTSAAGISGRFARLQLPEDSQQEVSKSSIFSAEVDEMQRKIGRRLDALRESRLQKFEGKL